MLPKESRFGTDTTVLLVFFLFLKVSCFVSYLVKYEQSLKSNHYSSTIGRVSIFSAFSHGKYNMKFVMKVTFASHVVMILILN